MKIVGHRGAPTLATENTLLSFAKAIECNVAMLEFDIRLSKDAIPVVLHDANLLRVWRSNAAVSDTTYQQLKKLADTDGQTIISLQEMLEAYGTVALCIDIKVKEALEVVIRTMQTFPKISYIVTSFDLATALDYKKHCPEVKVFLADKVNPYRAIRRAKKAGLDGVTLNHRWTLLPLVHKFAKRQNKTILSYPVNKYYSKAEQLLLVGIIKTLHKDVFIATDYPQNFTKQKQR